MQAVNSDQLLKALESIQAGVGRHRPLARVRQQLLGDLAALLTGLRCVLMLDYAPGTTPHLLTQALAPLQTTLPGWRGCTLELEGCCYLANSDMLLQQLAQLATGKDSWPVVICFEGGEAQQVQAGCVAEQLQQQTQQLHAAVAKALGRAGQSPCSAAGQAHVQPLVADAVATTVSQAVSASVGAVGSSMHHQAAARKPDSLSCNPQQGWLPNIQLGRYPGLPAMPTLNGMLLGYPAVYYVRDYQGAAAASRVLSASELKLHRVVATAGPQLSAFLKAAAGTATQKIAGTAAADAVVLMSFTVPDTVDGAVVEGRVQQTLQRLQGIRKHESCDVWQSVGLDSSWVGPQAVSL